MAAIAAQPGSDERDADAEQYVEAPPPLVRHPGADNLRMPPVPPMPVLAPFAPHGQGAELSPLAMPSPMLARAPAPTTPEQMAMAALKVAKAKATAAQAKVEEEEAMLRLMQMQQRSSEASGSMDRAPPPEDVH